MDGDVIHLITTPQIGKSLFDHTNVIQEESNF